MIPLSNSSIFKTIALFAVLQSCNSGTSKSETIHTNTLNQIDSIHMKTINEIIIDVRTPEEWVSDGHAACSVNYPLDEIQNKVDELKKYQHIVLVCRSGNRAGIAKRQLENAGITNIDNLGAWQNVQCAN